MALSSGDAERRATLLIDAGRYRQAIALLADALAHEQTARMWCCLALAHWRLGSAEETLQAAEQAILLGPELEWGHRLRGLALGKLDRIPEGLESIRRSTELAPHWWRAWTDLAELALRARELDEARAAAERGLELAPEEEWAVRVAMFTYSRAGDLGLAERTAEQLLRIHPDSSHALNMLGWVQVQRGNRERALPIFERALAANPTNRVILGNVFDALLGLERYEEAADLAGRMIDLAPEAPASWCSLGWVRFRQRRYSEAAEAAHKATVVDPENEWGYRLGAVVAGKTHDDAEALRLIRRATELDRSALNRQTPWLVRAAIAARLGLRAEAEESLARAAELDPTSVRYHRQVAEVADRAGDCARAEAAAQAALARAPFSLDAHLTAAKAAVCRHDWRRAEEWYVAARKHDPRDCCARAGLLLCELEASGPTAATDDELRRLDDLTDCRCTLVERLERWAAGSG